MKEWLKELLTGKPWGSWLYYRPQDELRTLAKYLLGRRPLYRSEDLDKQPFFIFSARRSGSTLLRAILCRHEAVSIPPEFWTLGEMIREYKRYSFLPWPWLLKIMLYLWEKQPRADLWGFPSRKIYERLEATPGERQSLYTIVTELYDAYSRNYFPAATLWGDKTPLHTENLLWIEQLFPRARYIHLVRDGRDVVSSHLKHGLSEDLRPAARHWKKNLRRARGLQSRIDSQRFLRVCYEQLVRESESVVVKVCDFLEINYDSRMLQPWKLADTLPELEQYDHYDRVSQPISTESVGKWQTRISDEEHVRLHELLLPELQEEGYLN